MKRTVHEWCVDIPGLRWLIVLAVAHVAVFAETSHSYRYATVIRKEARDEAGWKEVADSLVRKHGSGGRSELFTWNSSVHECKAALAEFGPDYIGYVARPVVDCNAAFIVAASRLSRELDGDAYGDAVWGIITGYEAADALRAISESLTVKTVLAASGNLAYEPPLQRFHQAIGMTCDSYTKTDYLFADGNGRIHTEEERPGGERDRIKLVCAWMNAQDIDLSVAGQGTIEGPIDCLITGGHGNVNLWQCHYPDEGSEGYMRSSSGRLFGLPYSGNEITISPPTPKIYWCASNCLMGNPGNRNNIVYAAFHSGRAVQMFGFVNNASAGDEFMAWGVYDRVTKFAGRHTLAQGFFLSNNDAQFELQHPTGQVTTSLVRTFMDSTVFYGDPAGDVRFHAFDDSSIAYTEEISFSAVEEGSTGFTYTVTMNAHDLEFGAGYCYQFRPVKLLPVRIDPGTVVITENEGHTADITDNLLIWEMLAQGETLRKGASRTLKWSAVITDDRTAVEKAGQSAERKRPGMQIIKRSRGETLELKLQDDYSGSVALKVIDPAGKCRYAAQKTATGGSFSSFSLPAWLSTGCYRVIAEWGRERFVSSVVIVR